MSQDTCWWLDHLMPIGCGGVSRTGYTSIGVTVRRFLEHELHSGAGFVQIHHEKRIFEVVLNEEARGGCPIAMYLVGIHECAHILDGDTGVGKNMLHLKETDSRTQEMWAWRFVEATSKRLTYGTPDHVEFCFNSCVRAEETETPERCEQPDLGGLLKMLEAATNTGGPTLAAALVAKIKSSAAWFSKAAKGLKNSDGTALIKKKAYPSKTSRKHRAARGTEGRIITFPRKGRRILEGRVFKNKHLFELNCGRIESPLPAPGSILGAAAAKLYVTRWVEAATGETLDLR